MTTEYKYITYTRRHMEEALLRSDEFYNIEYKKMREVARKLQEENARLQKALKAIAFAEFKENYPQELWAALLMDKAREALEGKE